MNDHRLIVSSAVARDLREMFGDDFDLTFIESPAIPASIDLNEAP